MMVLVALGIVLNGRMGNELITGKDVEGNGQQQEFPIVVQSDASSWRELQTTSILTVIVPLRFELNALPKI